MAYRRGATFIADWRPHCRVLDRNERARIIFLAEALERRTKPAGRRNGLIGYVGLAVLRCLMFGFMSHATGLCCPSYEAIQRRTGLCRASIAAGLARLERCGVLKIVRRLVRQRVERISPLTGQPESYVGTVQTTSLYSLRAPGAWADHLAIPPARPAPFPSKRQIDLLQRMELRWKARLDLGEQSSPSREERLQEAQQIAALVAQAIE
jgi:hypothetical protein